MPNAASGADVQPEPVPGTGPAQGATPGPVLEIAAGHPSAEEIAAVTAAISVTLARRRSARSARQRASGGWAGRAGGLRAPLRPGPDAWRRSAWPARR